MLSLSKNFLFIHPQKSAGTSISFALEKYAEDKFYIKTRNEDGSPQCVDSSCPAYGLTKKHHTLTDYRKLLPQEIYRRVFKFSSIRNPWEQCVLRYFHYHPEWSRRQFIYDCERKFGILRRLICLRYTKRPFDRLRRKLRRPSREHSTPLDENIDFLIRFEHLQEDWQTLCRRLDLPKIELPHIRTNRYKYNDYRQYYDDKLVDIVGAIFSEEIKFGGYRFDG